MTKIFTREIDIFVRIRKTFTNVYKHIGIRKHSKLVQGTKLLFTFLSSRFFDMRRERHTISFYVDFSISPHYVWPPPQTTGLASASSENRLASSRLESQLTAFFSYSKILSPAYGHDVIHVPSLISYLGILLWHLWLSHPPCARVNTCTECVHLTNPCTKRKVLRLTKPKGKIYKTKNDNIKKIPPQLYYR